MYAIFLVLVFVKHLDADCIVSITDVFTSTKQVASQSGIFTPSCNVLQEDKIELFLDIKFLIILLRSIFVCSPLI